MAHIPGDEGPDRESSRAPRSSDDGPSPDGPGFDWRRWLLPLLGVALLAIIFTGVFSPGQRQDLNYTELVEAIQEDRVAEVTIDPEGRVTGTFENGERFSSNVPTALEDQRLNELLREHDVAVDATAPSTGFLDILLSIAPFVLLIGLFWYFSRRARGQLSQIQGVGKSRAKLIDEERPSTTFDEVAGYEGVKEEVTEAVDFLRDPTRYRAVGARGPGGVLMVGPPGTGKTLIARAVAGEADVPFLSVTGSSFVEMFVGVGASRVRDLFEKARKLAPCIIFIDELDAIGQRRRGSAAVMSNNEQEQTLNQLLAEMDGFDPAEGIVVMAATNRPGMLDKALLRPGRFDRQIHVDLPLLDDRRKILAVHTRGKPVSEGIDLDRVARGTPGFSGAELENLVNEAAITAVRDDREVVTQDDFSDARDRILLGRREESSLLMEDERVRVAVHESGHALIGVLTEESDPVSKVTILPTRRSLGETQTLPLNERRLYEQQFLEDTLAVRMGGRCAELLLLETPSSGAAQDLAGATDMAVRMVRDFGFSEKLGPVGYHQEEGPMGPDRLLANRPYAEETQRLIDEEVARVLREAEQRTTDLLDTHRDALEQLVEDLLERETVPGERVYELVGKPVPQRAEDAASGGEDAGDDHSGDDHAGGEDAGAEDGGGGDDDAVR